MEIDERLEKTKNVSMTWEEHINEKISENLKNAIKYTNGENLEEIEIDDMASIDSIEDGIVRGEILSGDMIEIPIESFNYTIEEGDIINLKLTYKEGELIKTQILGKNEEEKELRIKLIQEKLRRIREKDK